MFEIGDRVTILRDGGLVDVRADGRVRPRQPHRVDGRAQDRVALPGEQAARSASRACTVGGLQPAGRGGADRLRGRAPARSSASRGCSAPGAASCCGRSSAPTRSRPATSRSTASRCAPATRAARCRPGIGPADRGPQAARAAARAVDPRERLAGAPRRDLALLDRRQASASAGSSTSTSAACKLRAAIWEQPVSSLSGGNQQKVLLARWLATKAKVLMFDEPTKGVDVGAKAEIYKVIGDLAAEGLGVVVVSSYLPEVLGLADRVLVMREGTVAGELPAAGRDGGGRAAPGQHARQRDRATGHGVTRRDDMRFVKSTSHQPTAGGRRRRRAAPRGSGEPEERILTFGDVFGRDAGGLIVLLVLFGALTLASDEFLTGDNMANLARQVAVFGIIAVGQLLVILTAGIDLSVGSVLGLTGCITAELLVHGVGDRPGDPHRHGRRRRASACSTARSSPTASCRRSSSRSACSGSRAAWCSSSPTRARSSRCPTSFGNIANGDVPRPAEPAVDLRRGRRHRVVRAAPDRVRPLRLRGRLEPRVGAPGRRPGHARARRRVRDRRACSPRSAACCSPRA